MSLTQEILTLLGQHEASDKTPGTHEYGMVIYCDGGCDQGRANDHGPGGAGTHGYVYDYVTPKVISGCPPGYTLTDVGYFDSSVLAKRPDGDLDVEHWAKIKTIVPHPLVKKLNGKTKMGDYLTRRVNPIGYFNILEHLPRPTTNNRAELRGFINGLKEALNVRTKIKRVHIRMDSSYVYDGFVLYMDGWKNNGWKARGGLEDVKNIDLWKEVDELRQIVLKDNDILVTCEWVKGHLDYYGNVQADKNAGKSKLATTLREPQMSLISNTSYFKAQNVYNRLLAMPRWYYSTGEESNYSAIDKDNEEMAAKKIFYVGRHGNSEQDVSFGSKMPDLMYGVIITDDDPVLETLRKDFDNRSRRWQEDLIFLCSLDVIFSRETYDEFHEHGLKFTVDDGKTIKYHDDKTVAVQSKPINSAFVAMDFLHQMRRLLLRFMEGSFNSGTALIDRNGNPCDVHYTLTDITANIYGYKEGKLDKAGKAVGEPKRICLPDSPTIEVSAGHHYDGSTQHHDVILTRGIDIPGRSLFLGVIDDEPKVQLLTWHEGPYTFRYATIFTSSKGDAAIWLGAYSNLRILSKKEAKR